MQASLSRSVIGPVGQPCGGSKQIDADSALARGPLSGRLSPEPGVVMDQSPRPLIASGRSFALVC